MASIVIRVGAASFEKKLVAKMTLTKFKKTYKDNKALAAELKRNKVTLHEVWKQAKI